MAIAIVPSVAKRQDVVNFNKSKNQYRQKKIDIFKLYTRAKSVP